MRITHPDTDNLEMLINFCHCITGAPPCIAKNALTKHQEISENSVV